MKKLDRNTIVSNLERLAQVIDFNSNLISQMINKNLFTQQMIDDIQTIDDEMDRKKRFLFDLCRRGPDAYDQFVEILWGTGQETAAQILRPDLKTQNRVEMVENITSSPDIPPEPPFGEQEEIADMSSQGTISSVESQDHMINVKMSKRAFAGRNIYPMLANPRGYTLIVNIHKFKNEDLYPERRGSEAETHRLNDVFTQLQFNVKVIDNPSKDELLRTLERYRQSTELRNHDCLIVIVLSHGFGDYFISSDGLGIAFEDIISKFNNENCPQLIRRPKLFFFSCCRGDRRDTGPRFRYREDAVADAKNFSQSIVPTANDMMICYSTVNGYVSWRNEDNGSWFGTAIAQSLMKYAHKYDLHYILTIASSMVTERLTQNGEMQVMEHTFRGFTKLFYFNPGIPPLPLPQINESEQH